MPLRAQGGCCAPGYHDFMSMQVCSSEHLGLEAHKIRPYLNNSTVATCHLQHPSQGWLRRRCVETVLATRLLN